LFRSLGWDEYEVRRSEEFVLSTVAKHIEFLVETVKPRQYLFIAVDGIWLLKFELFSVFVIGSAPAAFIHTERTERILNKWKVLKNDSFQKEY